MSTFVTDYLETAATDPAAGFAMLTPSFQDASGGLSGYEGFWGDVKRVSDIEVVDADPDGLTVTYRYRYQARPGSTDRGHAHPPPHLRRACRHLSHRRRAQLIPPAGVPSPLS